MASTTRTEFDCCSCGACCGAPHDQDTYVDLLPEDVLRLSARYRRENVAGRPNWSALRTKNNHNGTVCVALRGTVGRRVSCGIYETRPRACRDFRPGSQQCREARAELGIELKPAG